jgi:hypothetical protein
VTYLVRRLIGAADHRVSGAIGERGNQDVDRWTYWKIYAGVMDDPNGIGSTWNR